MVETKGRVIRADSAEVLCVLKFAMLASEKRARGRRVMGPENRPHLEDVMVIPTLRDTRTEPTLKMSQ